VGLYYIQLKRFFDIFPREQLRVYLFDDYQRSPTAVIGNIFEFLEVDTGFISDTKTKYAATGLVRSRFLDGVLQQARRVEPIAQRLLRPSVRQRIVRLAVEIHNRNLAKPTLVLSTRKRLIERYRADILQLQDLLQRDLSEWLN
jgi:hypothetical protein